MWHLIAVLFTTVLAGVSADYVFTFQLLSFTDLSPLGICCEISNECPSSCNATLLVCLRDADSNENDNSCPQGALLVPVFSSDVEFSDTFPGIWTEEVRIVMSTFRYDQNATTSTDIGTVASQNLIDLVVIDRLALSPSDPDPTPETTFPGVFGLVSFDATFRVHCAAGFFGRRCAMTCETRDDSLGHFSCDPVTGVRVCLEGYSGVETNCTTCVPSPGCSLIGGFCEEPGECRCLEGFSGDNCSEAINASTATALPTSGFILPTATLQIPTTTGDNFVSSTDGLSLVPAQSTMMLQSSFTTPASLTCSSVLGFPSQSTTGGVSPMATMIPSSASSASLALLLPSQSPPISSGASLVLPVTTIMVQSSVVSSASPTVLLPSQSPALVAPTTTTTMVQSSTASSASPTVSSSESLMTISVPSSTTAGTLSSEASASESPQINLLTTSSSMLQPSASPSRGTSASQTESSQIRLATTDILGPTLSTSIVATQQPSVPTSVLIAASVPSTQTSISASDILRPSESPMLATLQPSTTPAGNSTLVIIFPPATTTEAQNLRSSITPINTPDVGGANRADGGSNRLLYIAVGAVAGAIFVLLISLSFFLVIVVVVARKQQRKRKAKQQQQRNENRYTDVIANIEASSRFTSNTTLNKIDPYLDSIVMPAQDSVSTLPRPTYSTFQHEDSGILTQENEDDMYARPVVISNSGAGTPDLEIEHTTDDRPDTPGLEEAVKKDHEYAVLECADLTEEASTREEPASNEIDLLDSIERTMHQIDEELQDQETPQASDEQAGSSFIYADDDEANRELNSDNDSGLHNSSLSLSTDRLSN